MAFVCPECHTEKEWTSARCPNCNQVVGVLYGLIWNLMLGVFSLLIIVTIFWALSIMYS